jgi:hypothetical protein
MSATRTVRCRIVDLRASGPGEAKWHRDEEDPHGLVGLFGLIEAASAGDAERTNRPYRGGVTAQPGAWLGRHEMVAARNVRGRLQLPL